MAGPKRLEMELMAHRLEILVPEVSEGPQTQKIESRLPRAVDGVWGVAAHGHRVSFPGEQNVLELVVIITQPNCIL